MRRPRLLEGAKFAGAKNWFSEFFFPLIINYHEIFRKAKVIKIRFTNFIPINSQKDIVKLVGEKERLNYM